MGSHTSYAFRRSRRMRLEIMLKQRAIINIRDKYQQLSPYLNEQTRRIWAATEALGRLLRWNYLRVRGNWIEPQYDSEMHPTNFR
jgi:hypothetical protein